MADRVEPDRPTSPLFEAPDARLESDPPREPPRNPPQSARPSDVSGQMGTPATHTGWLGWLYRLFDVDTDEVRNRVVVAVNPKAPVFLSMGLESAPGVLGKQPDLWGPIWIYQTAVFSMFFATTAAGMLFAGWRGLRYEYSIETLTTAAFGVGLLTFAAPAGLWFIIQFWNLAPGLALAQILCLFGYANTIWVFVALLEGAVFPPLVGGETVAAAIRWFLAAVGMGISGWFVFRNLHEVLLSSQSATVDVPKPKRIMVLGGAVVIEVALGAIMVASLSSASSYGEST